MIHSCKNFHGEQVKVDNGRIMRSRGLLPYRTILTRPKVNPSTILLHSNCCSGTILVSVHIIRDRRNRERCTKMVNVKFRGRQYPILNPLLVVSREHFVSGSTCGADQWNQAQLEGF